jgi:hypothetical protein
MQHLQAPPRLDPPSDLADPPLVPFDAEAGPSAEPLNLSALALAAADLHQQADAASGDGTVIRPTSIHRRPVLLPRAPARHRDPLSRRRPTELTFTQMTPLTIAKVPRPTVMRHRASHAPPVR